jgi:putative ubiquitin-RnfH superfamily antitoxin RatB of RatAB toxin-antitoxin module
MAHADAAELTVEVAYSPAARQVDRVTVRLPVPASLRDALAASGLPQRHGLVIDDALAVGVWGQRQPLDALLRDGDRVEIYRPLTVQPMQARRLRQQAQARKGALRSGSPKR